MDTIQICHCGSAEGTAHHLACPFPLYEEGPSSNRWSFQWKYNCGKPVGLSDVFTFGPYQNAAVGNVIASDPTYIGCLYANTRTFSLEEDAITLWADTLGVEEEK